MPLGNPTWRGTEPCGKAEGPAQKAEQAQAPSPPSLIDLTGHYWPLVLKGPDHSRDRLTESTFPVMLSLL